MFSGRYSYHIGVGAIFQFRRKISLCGNVIWTAGHVYSEMGVSIVGTPLNAESDPLPDRELSGGPALPLEASVLTRYVQAQSTRRLRAR